MSDAGISGRVAAVIVTFNSGEYIVDCLESLKGQSCGPLDIVVVDNRSTDKTVEMARPFGVHLIQNAGNLGFAAANNQGVKYAVETLGSGYILLLNPDTVADARLVEEMVRTLGLDESIGIVQGKLFLLREKGLLNTDGVLHHYLYFGYCGGFGLPDGGGPDREIAVASGACLMFRKGLLDRMKYLFNEAFFMYHEDTDLCLRARLMGYRVVLSSKAVVWHDYRFGSGKKKFFHMEKNRLFLMFQNYRALTLLMLLPAVVFTECQVLFYSLLKGWFFYKVKSYFWLAGNIGNIMRRRREVQRTRLIGDGELLKLFATELNFEELHNPGVKYITNPALKVYYRFVTWALRALGGGR